MSDKARRTQFQTGRCFSSISRTTNELFASNTSLWTLASDIVRAARKSLRTSPRENKMMSFPSLFCTDVFVCTAMLCWNHPLWEHAFYNLTDCTPRSLSLISTARLQPSSVMRVEHFSNGFVCSHCRWRDFIQFSADTFNQCEKQRTRIELNHFCRYSSGQTRGDCRCVSSSQPIEPIRRWRKVDAPSGKARLNTDRVLWINRSAWLSASLLIGSVGFLILSGGLIALFVYLVKLKSNTVDVDRLRK